MPRNVFVLVIGAFLNVGVTYVAVAADLPGQGSSLCAPRDTASVQLVRALSGCQRRGCLVQPHAEHRGHNVG